MLSLKSLGGAGTVTGSKHLLTLGGHRILIDCGLFQGLKNLRDLNWTPLPVSPRDIDAVILTHAHLDHCGYLPRLVREGYRGKIYATSATRDVAELILMDSGHLQEKDAEFLNRHKLSRHQPALPLYTVHDAQNAVEHFSTVEFDQTVRLSNGAWFRFHRAGHILGAAWVEMVWGGQRIVFSGDIGRYGDPLMPDPARPVEADYVMIESTYGNRIHDKTDPEDALRAVVERTIRAWRNARRPGLRCRARAGTALLFLEAETGRGSWGRPRVPRQPHGHRCDRAHGPASPGSPARCSKAARSVFGIARYTDDVEASKAISSSRVPKIVISASGMATGGRVLHHLKAFAPDPRNTILLAGFQAAGTRGRCASGRCEGTENPWRLDSGQCGGRPSRHALGPCRCR
jgi:metallo-beta-lactamase family protein